MKTKRQALPKTTVLRIRIWPHWPNAESVGAGSDGRWRFYCSIDGRGTPAFSITAKTAKGARKALKDYLYNELDTAEEIETEE